MNKLKSGRIDWLITLAPFIIIMILAGVLFVFPEQSNNIIGQVRFFFGDTNGHLLPCYRPWSTFDFYFSFLFQNAAMLFLENQMKNLSIRFLFGEV